jgi:hypothetical protein
MEHWVLKITRVDHKKGNFGFSLLNNNLVKVTFKSTIFVIIERVVSLNISMTKVAAKL